MKGLKLKILHLRSTDMEADQLLSYHINLRINEGLIMEDGMKRWQSNTETIKSTQSEKRI